MADIMYHNINEKKKFISVKFFVLLKELRGYFMRKLRFMSDRIQAI